MNSPFAVAVIEVLSHVDRVAPDNLDYSLYDYVDLDALSALANHPDTNWKLTFEVPSHEVSVTGEGIIMVDGVRFDANRPCSP